MEHDSEDVCYNPNAKHGKVITVEFDLPRGRLTKVEFDKFIHLISFFLRTQNLNYEKFFNF